MVKTEKTPFNAFNHTIAEHLVKGKTFATRSRLFKVLVGQLDSFVPTRFDGDKQKAALVAQRLAFMPAIKSGWGRTESNMETFAKQVVDSYFAHVEAFSAQGFPAPDQAAFDALGDYELAV